MSLLKATQETCIIMDKRSFPDGYGGIDYRWVEGASFAASIALDNSIEGATAQAQGVTALYTVLTDKAINLQYHDVFKRTSDDKVFRVTTDGDDDKTPRTAGLNLRKVRAEEWVIPDAS